MSNEKLTIGIYGQHSAMAGHQCWDEAMVESESDDLIIFTGTREELVAEADAMEAANQAANSNTAFRCKVARTIREGL